MDKIAKSSNKERTGIFIDVANKLKLQPFIIEKDFWVSWVLGKIFDNQELSKSLCFKGGTSLSKGFNLIERFSEDIDLILNQNLILQEDEEILRASKRQQEIFNKTIEERACTYISTTLKEAIEKAINPICTVKEDDDDKHVLWIEFPKSFNYDYLRKPNEQNELSSFVGKALPELKLEKPKVPTIKPERTFWEKITILHLEHHRPSNKTIAERHSRHYYDVYMLGNSFVKQNSFNNLNLLDEVVEFKQRFYPCSWAKYDEAKVGTLALLPPEHSKPILAKDYVQMQNMIFGNYPNWDEIIEFLKQVEDEINRL